MKTIKTAAYCVCYFSFFSLTGCSTVDAFLPKRTVSSGTFPVIPEIESPVVQPRIIPKTIIRSTVKNEPVVRPLSTSRSVEKTKKTVLVLTPKQLEEQKRLKEEAKQRAIKKSTVDIDPFATIPDSSTKQVEAVSNRSSSPAVKSLLISARADIALGRSRSAVTKLERALRIEPNNAKLWHMLAKAHFSNSAYLHAISIAKKSNANTDDRQLIRENWKLIKQAGEHSDNATAIKEAFDYMKLNP